MTKIEITKDDHETNQGPVSVDTAREIGGQATMAADDPRYVTKVIGGKPVRIETDAYASRHYSEDGQPLVDGDM